MSLLENKLFSKDATFVAPAILGAQIFHKTPKGQLKSGIIVETEAYMPEDPACHASKGLTKRTAPMFEEGGICYVYLIYGMYYCMNIVTGPKGSGQAVLIRALELPHDSTSPYAASGPGKLCRYLEITKEQNGLKFCKENSLWLELSQTVDVSLIQTSTRIGISQGKEHLWRYYIKNNQYVSKTKNNAFVQ
jgi:DNA-3-methyladenine glycosylase